MLEDDFTYVIRKALKGHALAPSEAAQRAGLSESDVLAFTRGTFSAEIARRLAPILGLNADALARHPDYLPQPIHHSSIQRLDLPSGGDDRVNVWLISSGSTHILFDTGQQPTSATVALDAMGIAKVDRVFLTHDHYDHVGGIPSFLARNVILHGPHIQHTLPLHPGETVFCGPLTLHAHDLSGHATPALGYLIHGPGTPIFVTGDALFAGSIGGCLTPTLYQNALRTLRAALTPLPDTTLLLPGHGPATTLGEERRSNPFL